MRRNVFETEDVFRDGTQLARQPHALVVRVVLRAVGLFVPVQRHAERARELVPPSRRGRGRVELGKPRSTESPCVIRELFSTSRIRSSPGSYQCARSSTDRIGRSAGCITGSGGVCARSFAGAVRPSPEAAYPARRHPPGRHRGDGTPHFQRHVDCEVSIETRKPAGGIARRR